MKSFISPAYTFTPGASGAGTVNLSGIPAFNLRFLVAIINKTRGVTIYATGNSETRYTLVSGTTITLFADTTGQLSTDVLDVIYEDQTGAPISDTAAQSLPATPVRQVGQMVDVSGFSSSGASVLDPFFKENPVVSGSVSYNQAAGSLNVVASTTANAEFLARSVKSYKGSMRVRFGFISSQRIVNNNFAVMLADLIGELLAYTINSATSVTVDVPGHKLTSAEVGQFVLFGGITGAAAVPGRYAIASIVTGTSITLTVAGFPVSGNGTCTLFGRNYIRCLFTGVTATSLSIDAQRNGWAAGDTNSSVLTTVSPGAIFQFEATGREVFWTDSLKTSTTSGAFSSRGVRYENIPDAETELYVFLWNFNGATAPASVTTWTIGSVSVESFSNNSVYIQGLRSVGTSNAMAVSPTGGTITSVTAASLGIPGIIADIASSVISVSATTVAPTPTSGTSYIVSIPVTGVTGTAPTFDVDVQESDDTATNWFTVYSFPRITATGIYRSPKLSFHGNRVRYVQLAGGASPSFTRAINRLQCSDSVDQIRQLIDRSIVLTNANSATPSIITSNCSNRQLVVSIGTAATVPAVQLQGSDDNALSWYSMGSPLTAVASSTVQLTVQNVNSQLTRAIVVTPGVTVTPAYVLIKGF
jgi:hypothetical protein